MVQPLRVLEVPAHWVWYGTVKYYVRTPQRHKRTQHLGLQESINKTLLLVSYEGLSWGCTQTIGRPGQFSDLCAGLHDATPRSCTMLCLPRSPMCA